MGNPGLLAGRPAITVVTPWWNCHELAEGYWAAINAAVDPFRDVSFVIDNGSDPPLGFAGFGARLEANVGFSRACNIGLAQAPTDAVLFLNNDVRLGRAGWLEPIRKELRSGVLVGAHLRSDAHTRIDGRTFHYLDGWCLAGMREDLVDLGGWDEGFEEPSYYGDNDLCLRARFAGMRLVQVDVSLRHLSNYTTRRFDVTGVSARNRERFAARARELYGESA